VVSERWWSMLLPRAPGQQDGEMRPAD